MVAQNRFKKGKRQDSFHFEKTDLDRGLSVPNEQVRRHSTGNVATGTINIAALQPNLENLKVNNPTSLKNNVSRLSYLKVHTLAC